ncbi:MAG: glycosyltransferase family 4 protein, partial [Candidatus Odinarchaeota archaeon]
GGLYSFYMVFPSLISRSKIITFMRGDELLEIRVKYKHPIPKIYQLVFKVGILKSYRILSVNHDLVQKVMGRYGLPLERFKVIPNSIPLSVIAKESKELLKGPNLIIGFAGKFQKNKGVGTLLKALQELMRRGYYIEAYLVGKGPEEPRMTFFIEKNNMQSNVHLLPWEKSLDDFYDTIDLLISPSLYEGCPNVVLEAIAKDIPAIGSSVGGTKEILEYEELLFKPNDFQSLVKKLEGILKDKNVLYQYQKLVRNRRQKFIADWKEITTLALSEFFTSSISALI